MASNTKKRTNSGTAKSRSAGKQTTKKNGSGKPRAASQTSRKKNTNPGKQPVRVQEYTDPRIKLEVLLWCMLAVCILIFISFFGIGGYIGKAVSSFFFGCFGILAYILPFGIVFLTAFLIANRRSRIAHIKAAAGVGLYLVLCGFAQLLMVGFVKGLSAWDYYEASAEYCTGGGLAGGCLAGFFGPAIGVAGAYIVLLILAIICIVLITQRSIFSGMKHQGKKVYRNAKEGQARRKEEHRIRREYYQKREAEYFDLSETKQEGAADRKRAAMQHFDDGDSDTLSENLSILPKQLRQPRNKKRVTGVTKDTKLYPAENEDMISMPEIRKPARRLVQPIEETYTADDFEDDQPIQIDPPKTSFDFLKDIPIQREAAAASRTETELHGRDFEDDKTEYSAPDSEQISAEDLMREQLPETRSSARDSQEMPEAADPQDETHKKVQRKPKASAEEVQEGIEHVEAEIEKTAAVVKPEYVFPPCRLLKKGEGRRGGSTDEELRETAAKLQQTLHTFGVNVKITNVSCGPSVTRYELMPEMGVKVSKIVNLTDDIKLNLAASDIRIEAPIPGKAAVGIEIPNKESSSVYLRDLLESEEFRKHPSNLAYAVGKDIAGKIVVSDIAKMPHLLIAGATGSGKSVFINTLIMSIIYKAKPEDVKLIMIDPKVVELSVYNGIPHLFIPVVTDPKKAAGALNWGVAEMTQRYQKFAEVGVRDLKGYNAKVEALKDVDAADKPEKLPQIVIIVDELADLMMVASGEVEDAICRLAQLARACGIHLVIATQRPSVDVITGLIKANMPSRIAFSVSSGVDSRTILDMNGAEKLLGNGDMLFAPQTYKKPARIQGAFVSDGEVSDVVEFLKEKNTDETYHAEMEAQIARVQKSAASSAAGGSDVDELFADAGKFIIEKDKASIGMLQRWFKIGFNRAARIMDQLSDAGVVGPEEGTKPRKIIMSMEQFENYLEEN